MERLFIFVGGMAMIAATLSTAQADSSSKRHLVYSFTIGVQSDQHMNQVMDSRSNQYVQSMNSGDSSQKGAASDRGEITVDYGSVEADGGLVVTVAETARTNRTAQPNTCVVYPNTSTICGS